MPKVSIVIPAYNTMSYLPETLDSVLKQTFTDFEVLIINDGSTDHISTWADGITDPRVKLISQTNQGLSGARNTGIEHAQGEYIAFLDADDLWNPTKLEKQVRCFHKNPSAGVVYTWTLLIDEQGRPTGRVFASHAEGNVWQKLFEEDVISNGSSAMYRRCCFDMVGGFDCSLSSAEDLDMWLRITEYYPFAVVKEPLTLYRQHPQSISKNSQRMFQSLLVVIEKAFQNVPLERLYLRNRAYAFLILRLAWGAIGEGDWHKACYFRQQSVLHLPQICFSESFLRLNIAIMMIRLFGPNGYDGIRKLTQQIRYRINNISTSSI